MSINELEGRISRLEGGQRPEGEVLLSQFTNEKITVRVREILKIMDDTVIETETGPVRFMDASPEQRRQSTNKRVREAIEDDDKRRGFNVEDEIWKIAHLLPEVRGIQ